MCHIHNALFSVLLFGVCGGGGIFFFFFGCCCFTSSQIYIKVYLFELLCSLMFGCLQ